MAVHLSAGLIKEDLGRYRPHLIASGQNLLLFGIQINRIHRLSVIRVPQGGKDRLHLVRAAATGRTEDCQCYLAIDAGRIQRIIFRQSGLFLGPRRGNLDIYFLAQCSQMAADELLFFSRKTKGPI